MLRFYNALQFLSKFNEDWINEQTIKCIKLHLEYLDVKTFFEILTKNPQRFLTYLDIAKAWLTTRNSNSFRQAVNDDHRFFLLK